MGCDCCDCWPTIDASHTAHYITDGSGNYVDLANTTAYPATNITGRYEWKYDAASGINFASTFTVNGISYRGGTVAAGGLGELGVDYRWIYETNSASVSGNLASYVPAGCGSSSCHRCRSYHDNGFGFGVAQGCNPSGGCPDVREIYVYRYRVIQCSLSGQLVDFTSTAVRPGLWPTPAQCSAAPLCLGGNTYDSDTEAADANNKLNYYNQFCDDCSCDDDLVKNYEYPNKTYFVNGMPGASASGSVPAFDPFPPELPDTPATGKPGTPIPVKQDGGPNGYVVGAKLYVPDGNLHDINGELQYDLKWNVMRTNPATGKSENHIGPTLILEPQDAGLKIEVTAINVVDEVQAEKPEDERTQQGDLGPSDPTPEIKFPSDPAGPPRRAPVGKLIEWKPYYYNKDKVHRPGTGLQSNPD